MYAFKTRHAWLNINDVITNYKKGGIAIVSWYLCLHARTKKRENLCSNIRSLWSNTQANEYKTTVAVTTPTALYLPCWLRWPIGRQLNNTNLKRQMRYDDGQLIRLHYLGIRLQSGGKWILSQESW